MATSAAPASKHLLPDERDDVLSPVELMDAHRLEYEDDRTHATIHSNGTDEVYAATPPAPSPTSNHASSSPGRRFSAEREAGHGAIPVGVHQAGFGNACVSLDTNRGMIFTCLYVIEHIHSHK